MIKQIRSKYDSMSIVLKASLWATFCGFAQKGISLLVTPIFTRMLTTEQYGVVTLYLSWLNILTVICTLNVTYGGFHNGMIKYPENKEQYTSSTLFLTTVMTAAWFLIYLVFHNEVNSFTGLTTFLTILLFIEILTQAALQIWTTRQRYDFEYRKATLVTMATVILTPIIGVFGVYFAEGDGKVVARILSFVVVYVVVGTIIYAVVVHKGHQLVNKEYWNFTLKFNIPLIPHYLSQSVLNQSDRIMINKMCGIAQAGIYGLAYNVGMLMNILTSAINSAFIPWMYRKLKEKDEKEIGIKANYILLLLVVLISGMMLFAPEIVHILGSEQYYEAVYVVPPIAGSVFFIFLFSLFANVELYYEKNVWVMMGSIIAAILNLMLNAIFIRRFGYLAAGYTTLVSYIIISVVHYCFMVRIRRSVHEDVDIYDMKVVMALSLLMIFISVTVPILYSHFWVRYFIIALIALGVIVSRNKIMNLIRSLKKKEG